MKFKLFLLILPLFTSGLRVNAQCKIKIQPVKSIICGNSVQLDALPAWDTLQSNTLNTLNSVFFINQDTGYFCGEAGTILYTANGGKNLYPQSAGVTSTLNSIQFIDNNRGFSAGVWGLILKTVDGGSNWDTVNSGTSEDLKVIRFVNRSRGYIFGNKGTILKTVNGGNTWTLLNSGVNWDFLSGYFTGQDTGYVIGTGGSGSGILKTTNGGVTWVNILTLPSLVSGDLFFTSPNTGYIAATAGTGFIMKTTNAGANWTTVSTGNYFSSIYFTSEDTGFACSNGIYRTVNNGIDWIKMPSPASGMKNIIMTGSKNGYAAGWSGKIIKYHDNFSSYTWFPAIHLSDPDIHNPAANPVATTTYYLNAKTKDSCIATDSITLVVKPLAITSVLNNYVLLTGEKVRIDSIRSNYDASGILKYKWSPSDGLSSDTIPDPEVSICHSNKYYFSISTPNGCSVNDSIFVSILPGTVTGSSSGFICGDSARLGIVTGNMVKDSLKYLWSPSAGLSDSTIPDPVVYSDTTRVYQVILTTQNGCQVKGQASVTLNAMPAPALCIVGVDSLNKNVIVWEKPEDPFKEWNTGSIDYFSIYRETNVSNVYDKVGTVPYDSHFIFTDTNSNPPVQSNRYKLSLTDKCGKETTLSVQHKTMHLSINQGMGGAWNLIWEPYEGISISTYNIYRGTSPRNMTMIGTMPGSNTQYTDFSAPGDTLYYQVEIIGKACDPAKRSYNYSRSNIASNKITSVSPEAPEDNEFQFFPNPAGTFIRIISGKHTGEKFSVSFFDAAGKKVKQVTMFTPGQTLELPELTNGVYFVEINGSRVTEKQKLIIRK